jgi:hypothetical protein
MQKELPAGSCIPQMTLLSFCVVCAFLICNINVCKTPFSSFLSYMQIYSSALANFSRRNKYMQNIDTSRIIVWPFLQS